MTHRRAFPALLTLLAAGCAVGPNYSRPPAETPPAYKELGAWALAQPSDNAPKGKWWEVFGDPVLNGLEEQVSVSNQSLKSSEAVYRQALAAVRSARAQLFPIVSANGSATRSGGGSGSSSTASGVDLGVGGSQTRRYNVSLNASWEPDLWGRVRRLIEAARDAAEASASDVENARLSLQAELATDYLQLRGTDAQITLYEEAIKAYQTNYQLTLNRYNAGVAGKSDVVQAETQLKTAQAQAIDLRPTRAQYEHAIAVLVGKPPAEITLEPMHTEERVPEVPPGVPSTLLERRPDVAAAERRAAAANARIGVAQAAYFPTLSLTGVLGFESGSLAHLISAPNRYWTLGASAAETLLDFGARAADVETARAAYDQSVADYRQAVLTGFQEVEDNLANIHWLADEAVVQRDALAAARESVRLTLNQYKAGTASYLDVTLVQATQFAAERTTVDLLQRRLVANVSLIRALGGSWSAQ